MIKLKYHKIRNVPKEDCTCEQMIAYNMASRSCTSFIDKFKKAKECSEMCANNFVNDIIDYQIKSYMECYPNSKYNIDAIQSCLRAGLKKYLEKPFIAWDYKQVGKAFPAYYL